VKKFTFFLMENRVEGAPMHKELATNGTNKSLKLCVPYKEEEKLNELAFWLGRITFCPSHF
jgi:hypothetical protein